MSAKTLPAEFHMAMIDDAMAPLAGAGVVVKFRSKARAKPGDAVLVRSKSGEIYFREYRQGLGSRWTAHPTQPAFLSLDSEADGLIVVAVFVGIDASWSKLQR